jgi:hypothetical protein
MGMDVYGKKPKNDQGEYFRANVWYWHPLWSYCEELHPSIASKVKNGHVNSGDGLNSIDSIALAELLKRDIETGVTEKYIKDYYDYLNSLPLEDCTYCNSTGTRDWPQEDGTTLTKECNGCKGQKKVKPFSTWYQMDLDLMKEFQQFLENCGGFKIC